MHNLKPLQVALSVHRTGSFSAAAAEEGISQSAVSQIISKLEEEIGFLLFDRKIKPIRVTVEGSGFLLKAQSLLIEAEQLWDYALEVEQEMSGELRVGIIPTVSPYLCPLFINEVEKCFPRLTLKITELLTKDIIQGLSKRSLDLGILSTPIKTSLKLDIAPVFYERFFLYVGSKHRLSKKMKVNVSDLEGHEVWLLNEGNCFSDQVQDMCNMPSALHDHSMTYSCNNLDSLRRIVEFRGGVTFLPELATLNIPAEREDMIKEISGGKWAREISAVTLKGEPKMHIISAFLETMVASLPPSMRSSNGKVIIETPITV